MIAERISGLRDNIEAVKRRSGREKDEIKLLLVTKTVQPQAIKEAYDAGCKIFGENKVQELMEKEEILPKDIEWHMVGHLQTNKVKYIAGKVKLIHSVDSIRLAKEISKRASKKDIIQDILVQVNTTQEESKFGVNPEKVNELLENISELSNIRILGLMTIGPFTEDKERVRKSFRSLKTLRDSFSGKFFSGKGLLSMGMTADYEIAIEEGTDILRIGSLIFGPRKVR